MPPPPPPDLCTPSITASSAVRRDPSASVTWVRIWTRPGSVGGRHPRGRRARGSSTDVLEGERRVAEAAGAAGDEGGERHVAGEHQADDALVELLHLALADAVQRLARRHAADDRRFGMGALQPLDNVGGGAVAGDHEEDLPALLQHPLRLELRLPVAPARDAERLHRRLREAAERQPDVQRSLLRPLQVRLRERAGRVGAGDDAHRAADELHLVRQGLREVDEQLSSGVPAARTGSPSSAPRRGGRRAWCSRCTTMPSIGATAPTMKDLVRPISCTRIASSLHACAARPWSAAGRNCTCREVMTGENWRRGVESRGGRATSRSSGSRSSTGGAGTSLIGLELRRGAEDGERRGEMRAATQLAEEIDASGGSR